MDMHYLQSNLVDYYSPLLSSRASPTSQLAILAKRCCIHREATCSCSGRLPASFGGLLGFLLAASEMLRFLLGRPEEGAESRMGFVSRIPYFLCICVQAFCSPAHKVPRQMPNFCCPAHRVPRNMRYLCSPAHRVPRKRRDCCCPAHWVPRKMRDFWSPTNGVLRKMAYCCSPAHRVPRNMQYF